MKQRLLLVLILAPTLAVSSFFASQALAADYKGAASAPPPRQFYKGEIESNDFASAVVPSEGKYSGKVFSSDLYQGEVKGPGYSPSTNRSLHDGFYLGVEGGWDSYNMKANANILHPDGAVAFQENPNLNASGFSYALFGGYGIYFDAPLYAGVEFFYNYSLANTTQNVQVRLTGNYYLKGEILGTYGLSFTPGVKLTDSVLLYLKGGYTRLDVKTYQTLALYGVNNAQSNGVNGYHFGLGLEANIYKAWSLRGEYTHLSCENFKTEPNTTFTPSNNQFMLGLVYHVF